MVAKRRAPVAKKTRWSLRKVTILCTFLFGLIYTLSSVSVFHSTSNMTPDFSSTSLKQLSDNSLSLVHGNRRDRRTEHISPRLPAWLEEYLEWHKDQRKLLRPGNEQDVQSMRFLLMECWPWNRVCGGTADRLRSIPLMLLVAYQTKRLLLIKWGRPAELEEFLLPPQGGLDWRVPPWLIPRLANQSKFHAASRVDKLIQRSKLSNETVIATRLQVHDHGATYYNDQRKEGEPMLRDVYREIWRRVFTPTPTIATLIEQQLQSLTLVPGAYAAAHLRAQYVEQERKPDQVRRFAENAVNCASMLRPGGPIFFSSDSALATQMAISYGRTKGEGTVVARTTALSEQPLHLDKAPEGTTPAAFYDTFVDLFLMGMSRCLVYNIGGYGKWGLMLGYNSSCAFRHQKGYGYKRDGLIPCQWTDAGETYDKTQNGQENENPLLLPPIAD